MTFNPQPKPNSEKLKKPSVAWTKRVDELYKREAGICQGCGKFLFRNEANPHHIITRGSGGSDDLPNLDLLCTLCHVKIDTGELVICDCGKYVFRKEICMNCGA